MNSTFFSNFSSAHFEAHKKFIGGVDAFDCSFIMSIDDPKERCEFSKNPRCHDTDAFVDYITMLFCDITEKENAMIIYYSVMTAVTLLIMALLIMNSFSSYAYNTIATIRLLRAGEYIGGAICVVFFNGASDILSRVIYFKSDIELVIAEMFGTGLLVMTFHAGVILLIFPTIIRPSFFLRDQIIMFITYVFLRLSIAYQPVHIAQGIILMACYCVFLIISIGHFVIRRRIDLAEGAKEGADAKLAKRLQPLSIGFNEDREFGEGTTANDQLFKQFFRTLNPIKANEFADASCIKKTFLVLAAPLRVFYILVLPCVNYTLPGHGWSKLMNCINLVLTPLSVAGVIRIKKWWQFGFLLIPGLILAPIVFVTSRTDQPPWYHSFFAVYGCIGSTCLNYFLTSELRSMWAVIGIIQGISVPIMGMTIFAWGNTIQDIVQNMTIAGLGFSSMAFVGYIYCPMLNIFFAIGMMMTLKYFHFNETVTELRAGELGETAGIFLYITIVATTISVWLTRFQLRRSIGAYLVCIYIIYLFYIIFSAFDWLHDYGTDHEIDISHTKDAEWS